MVTCAPQLDNGLHMRYIAAVFTIMLLTGCTLTPGSHISLPDSQSQFQDGDLLVNVKPINAQSLQELTSKKQVTQSNTLVNHIIDADEAPYRIGVGDVVTVVVWEHPELTSPLGQFRSSDEQGNIVYEDGTIFYPYAGKVKVEGKTVSQVRNEIASKLQKFIENPQVDVRVAGYKSQKYVVSGNVQAPGIYPITNVPQRILDALNISGGISDQGNIFAVTLTRGQDQIEIPMFELLYHGKTDFNILLQDGDVLHVQENSNRQVFVMGEVARPQTLQLTDLSISLTQALSAAGGINELKADSKGIYVVRAKSEQEIDIFQVSLKQAYYFALADQFQLEERDIVYVSAAPITRWNRFISNILPSITSIRTLDDINRPN